MLVCPQRQHPAARGSADEALLQQIGLDDLFQCVARFGQRRRHRLDADRATVIVPRNAIQIAMIERVETLAIDLKLQQRLVGDCRGDRAGTVDGGEIAHPPQQTAGDAGRASAAPGDLHGAVLVHRHAEHAGATS